MENTPCITRTMEMSARLHMHKFQLQSNFSTPFRACFRFSSTRPNRENSYVLWCRPVTVFDPFKLGERNAFTIMLAVMRESSPCLVLTISRSANEPTNLILIICILLWANYPESCLSAAWLSHFSNIDITHSILISPRNYSWPTNLCNNQQSRSDSTCMEKT